MRIMAAVAISAIALSAQVHRSKAVKASPPKQATQSQQQAWPIGKLTIEGNRVYPIDGILQVAGLQIGQSAGKGEFEAARDRLLATGMFESVGYRFEPLKDKGEYSASFQVVEIDQLFPYRFEGIQIDRKAFGAFVRKREPLLVERIPGTQPVLDRMARYTEDYLKEQGAPQVVRGRLLPDTPGQLVAVFMPATLPSVAEVHFRGNSVITKDALQQAISGAAIGSIYAEDRFRQILEASLRPVYEAQGRLRVQFPSLSTVPAKDVNGLVVTVQVVEGPEFKLRKVKVSGTDGRDAQLLKAANFHIGDVVNYTQVQGSVEQIAQAMRREGYIQVKTRSERAIDDKGLAVDVVVFVEPGPQYKMGKLAIEGLDIETEPHVRKLWAMQAGQPYDSEYPDYFLSRLKSDELFDNLGKSQSVVKPDAETKIVDVTLKMSGDGKPRPSIGPQDPRRKRQEQRPQGQWPPF